MKVFVLREPEHGHALVHYLKEHAGPQADAGRPLAVTVAEYRAKRSHDANARYWAILGEISEQAVIGGRRFSREVWHEALKDRFAPKEEGPSGLVAMSTTLMDTEQFSRYMSEVESHAAQELGVEFSAV